MYFSKSIPGVNPVVINYKITRNKNQPVTCKDTHGGMLAQWVN